MSGLTLRERLISSSLSMPGMWGEFDGEPGNFNVCTEAAERIAELEAQFEAVKAVIEFGETSSRIHDANGDFLIYTKDVLAALEQKK